jgi:hypothetical protein
MSGSAPKAAVLKLLRHFRDVLGRWGYRISAAESVPVIDGEPPPIV